MIRHEGPWKDLEHVEHATLNWIHWYNNTRLYEPFGYVAPATFEEDFYKHHASQNWRHDRNKTVSDISGAIHRWPNIEINE